MALTTRIKVVLVITLIRCSVMSFLESTNPYIIKELGGRVRRKRIGMNLSQLALAKKSGISRRTVQAIEAGDSISLDKLIAILRSLDSLDAIDSFLPESEISPLQMVKNSGYLRKRAYSKNHELHEDNGEYEW